jgi:hypothetical protein
MDKAEAILQPDPSLFSLGAAVAFASWKGSPRSRALEGVITCSRPSRRARSPVQRFYEAAGSV